jgi:protein phosphatase
MYYCCGITEKGNMPHNEDALLIGKNVISEGAVEQKLKPPFMAAVSDGVSGELSGDVASKKCLELVSEIKYSSKVDISRKLTEVHRKLAVYGCGSMNTLNMQATFCGIAVDENDNVDLINVGDSRLYRFRGGRLRQISKDQSLVQMLYEEGSITHEELRTHVHKNIIFPVLGNVSTDPKIDIRRLDGGMEYGDILLLCTDGLSDYLSPLAIEEILHLPKSLPKRLELLVEKSLEKNCQDNITIAAVVYC